MFEIEEVANEHRFTLKYVEAVAAIGATKGEDRSIGRLSIRFNLRSYRERFIQNLRCAA